MPLARRLTRDEALGELARRFLRSHGPATIRDFVWWSGLVTADARRAFDIARAAPRPAEGIEYWAIGRPPGARRPTGAVHLLPIYDEYLVAYRDRHAVPHAPQTTHGAARLPETFQHALVIAGQVTGTWRTRRAGAQVALEVFAARRLTAAERRAIADRAQRYAQFRAMPVTLTIR